MINFKRRNTLWLAVLGIIIAFGLVVGSVPPLMQALILAVYGAAMALSVVEFGRNRDTLMDAIQRAPIRRRVSSTASEAHERAKDRGGYLNNNLVLMDIGVISTQTGYAGGMAIHRARRISKDDDGVRPFITLYVHPEEADRNAIVRFEVFDQHGDQQFVHEMKVFLRDGEMDIRPDHHLPLTGNSAVTGSGDWDVKVFLDGDLIGIHSISLVPSENERVARLSGNKTATEFVIIDEGEQSSVTSLGDLVNPNQGKSQNHRPRVISNNRRQ